MTYIERYNACVRIASLFNSEHKYDIVHDAYVYHAKRTGCDLFDFPTETPTRYFYTMIKREFHRWYAKERVGPAYRYFTTDELYSKEDSPDEILIGIDLYRHLQFRLKQSSGRGQEIFNLQLQGYNQKEIAEKLNVSKQLPQYHSQRFKLMVNNPIRTSTVNISKKITRKTYEEKYKNDYTYDTERGCDHNESYEIVVHKEKDEYLLIREKDEAPVQVVE